jgi:hypothetical protein
METIYKRLALKDVSNSNKYERGVGYSWLDIPKSAPNLAIFYLKDKLVDDRAADRLSFAMHNNSPNGMGGKIFSAYFTLYNAKVLIEWGKENANGELKLHTFLNEQIDLDQRSSKVRFFRSGHFAEITLPNDTSSTMVALIDCIKDKQVDNKNKVYNLVSVLNHNNILAVNSQGFPIKLI